MYCDHLIAGGFLICQRKSCGRKVKYRGTPHYLECLATCHHLGEPIEYRDGVTLTVKCGCGKQESRDVFHVAHECVKFKRCLPTLIPLDNAKWLERPEAAMYKCCRLCELNPANL